MGNTMKVVTFESEGMSAFQAPGAEIDRVSETPRQFSTGEGVVPPDGDGGARANSQPRPSDSPSQSMEPATPHKVGVARWKIEITRTRTDFLEKLERAVCAPPRVLGKKRRLTASAAEGQAEEWGECSTCAGRKTGVIDAGSKRAAKVSTEVVATAVSDAVED